MTPAFPIVLAHGVCPFDEGFQAVFNADNDDNPLLDQFHYFSGVRTMLKRHGFAVWHSRVDWAGQVDDRAEQLRKNILRTLAESEAEKVCVIAHSMGGLDVRHMLFNHPDMRAHVAALATIGTPHLGTSFADAGVAHAGDSARDVEALLNVTLEGLRDLTTERCRDFNAKALKAGEPYGIPYFTFAGRQKRGGIFAPLQLTYDIIFGKEGDNDGLVPVSSAKWRPEHFVSVLENTDHLNEIAWWHLNQLQVGEDPLALRARIHAFYLEVATRLSGKARSH